MSLQSMDPKNRSQGAEMAAAILPPVKSPAAGTLRPGAVTAVVCLALAAVVAAMSSLNVALPDVARATHASQTELAWIIDAYSLVFASLLLPAGALGDRYGRRRGPLPGPSIFRGRPAGRGSPPSARPTVPPAAPPSPRGPPGPPAPSRPQ